MVTRLLLTANDNSELIAPRTGDQQRCADVLTRYSPCGGISAPVFGSDFSVINQEKVGVNEILVDSVSDILTISGHNIRPVPERHPEHEKQYARGILATDKRMICLIEPVGSFPDTESEAA